MKPAFLAPHGMLDRKAPHGQPCTRCGLCCMNLCRVGFALFYREGEPLVLPNGPCPALVKGGDEYNCDVMRNPQKYKAGDADELRAAINILTYAGQGCDARFNGEPINHSFNQRLVEWDEEHAYEISEAKKLWGIT